MRHIVKLTIEDNIYHNIMFILESLQSKGLKIEEIKDNSSIQNTKSKIKRMSIHKAIKQSRRQELEYQSI